MRTESVKCPARAVFANSRARHVDLVPKLFRFAEIFRFWILNTSRFSEAIHVTYAAQRHLQIMTSLMTLLVSHFDADLISFYL